MCMFSPVRYLEDMTTSASLHLSGGRDLLDALVGGVSDDGCDEALVGRHGDGYVDGVEGARPVAGPRHVDFRHLLRGREG